MIDRKRLGSLCMKVIDAALIHPHADYENPRTEEITTRVLPSYKLDRGEDGEAMLITVMCQGVFSHSKSNRKDRFMGTIEMIIKEDGQLENAHVDLRVMHRRDLALVGICQVSPGNEGQRYAFLT